MARREHGDGSIWKRQDGRWTGQINMAPEGAARQRRTIYGKTKAEVVRKLGEAREAKRRGDRSTSSLTFGEWLDRWLARANHKPTTRRGYRSMISVHLKPNLGKVRLDRLTTDHVDALHDTLRAKGVDSTNLRNVHRCASAALSVAVAQGRVNDNVFRKVPAPAKSGKKPDALTPEAAVAVEALAASKGDAELTSMHAALFLGMRPGERLGLCWPRIDLDRREIDIAQQLQRVDFLHGCADAEPWACGRKRGGNCPERRLDLTAQNIDDFTLLEGPYILQTTKTSGSTRVVPIPNFMVAPLRRHWLAYLEDRMRPDFVDHGLVWHNGDGHPIRATDDRDAWHALLAEAGAPRTILYAARHTAATLMLERGVDVKVIQQILGHSEVLTTRGYQQVRLELARAALDRPDEPKAIGA